MSEIILKGYKTQNIKFVFLYKANFNNILVSCLPTNPAFYHQLNNCLVIFEKKKFFYK